MSDNSDHLKPTSSGEFSYCAEGAFSHDAPSNGLSLLDAANAPTMPTGRSEAISVAELKARVDLREIAALDMGQGQRQGKTLRWWNPPWSANTHQSGGRAFAVWCGSFYDFSTNERGDVITYFERAYHLSTADAVQRLREHVGGSHAPAHPIAQPAAITSPGEPPPSIWQRDASDASREAERCLWLDRVDARRVLNYLHERGLSDDTIHRFHLGYNPAWSDLSYCDPESRKRISLAPGIIIPYRGDDALWAVRIRRRVGSLAQALAIEGDRSRDGQPLSKYINLAGAGGRKPLFNADALRPGIDVLFVEGEFDAMIAQQDIGEGAAVVTFGATSNIPEHIAARWRDRLQEAGQVYLALDNDQAGSQAAQRLIAALVEIGKAPILYPIPAGKDATEFVVDHAGDLAAWWAERSLRGVIQGDCTTPADAYRFPGGRVPWRMQAAVNHFSLKAPGAAVLFDLIQRGLELGTLIGPHILFTQVQTTADRLGWHIKETTLRRYFEGEVPFLHPRKSEKLECNYGVERELLPIADLKEALKRLHKIELHVRYFRDKERTSVDASTGQLFTLPAVPADLPTQAFIDAGMDEVSARRVAEELADDPLPFDYPTKRRRASAVLKARAAHDEFCRLLDDGMIVPPSEDVSIASERDFKRALARAWHAAHVAGFQTQAEQMWALGIVSKHTLNTYLESAGVEKDERIERIELDPKQDIGKQIKASIRNLNAFPVTFVTGMGEGGEINPEAKPKRELYDRQEINAAIERGETVFVEYQQANEHHVVELPDLPAAQRSIAPRRERETDDQAKPPARRLKREIPTPGTYPATWTRNHLRLRYRLHFGKDAPDELSLERLVYHIGTDILLCVAKLEGAEIIPLGVA